ncbi:MAG: type 4a pilus biogenesis protein PilO [Nitrospira sp.]|nr:type 4a pilus biogenesis protein PilO [Nitrospira sp.]MDH4303108.1 type 4a pilus biogenesis protein PilO [Nitrospira sp.]MDH5192473.1 type 4a pilus biogenesis protein PilO [Nitrospira sp.]
MRERLIAVWQHPYAPLVPWGGMALGLFLVLIVVQQAWLADLQIKRQELEAERVTARQSLLQHREARRATKDLTHVWALLPGERDFGSLALGISDEAKREGVVLPALSYKTEPTTVARTTKGLLQGAMTGRYEDLRRFIHDLETADELLLIEDLELRRTGSTQDDALTFTIKIATYLRADHEKQAVPGAIN